MQVARNFLISKKPHPGYTFIDNTFLIQAGYFYVKHIHRKVTNGQEFVAKMFEISKIAIPKIDVNPPSPRRNYYIYFANTNTINNNSATLIFDELLLFIIDELNNFTKCLELYLTCFVERKEFLRRDRKAYPLPRITYIIDKVKKSDENFKIINFNYTNIIAYYTKHMNSSIDNTCFIHGDGISNINNEGDNLVLGMDENNPKNIDPLFVAFRKYFQRFIKKTDSKYYDWIMEIKESFVPPGFPLDTIEHNLHIVGHSLTPSDKQILYDLITLKNVKTTIYHIGSNEYQLAQNLAIILGSELFTELTSGSDDKKRITFERLP